MKASGIGGQAVMEGVMMKNKDRYAVAVRKEDQEIVVDVKDCKSISEKIKVFKLPILRGVVTFIESLVIGVKTLTYSASFFEDDPEEQKPETPEDIKKKERRDNAVMAGTVVLSVVLAVGIFMILPYFLSQLLAAVIASPSLLALCEGVIRVALFVGYVAAISAMKDIKRVFMYHGAEHKSINCIEHGLPLTVSNVKTQSREHKRCGTSFLLIVMVISILFFMFIRVDDAWLRVVLRLVLIPVIAGVSYEFIRFAGKTDNAVINALAKPGLLLQKLTTAEPDDDMIEVAIASVEAVFDWREFIEGCEPDAEDKPEVEAPKNGQSSKGGKKNNNSKNNGKQGSKPQDPKKAAADAKKKAQEEKKAAREAEKAEKARKAAEAKAAAEAEKAEKARKAEEERKAAEAKRAEEERIAAEAKKAEEERLAAEAKKAEEERLAAEAKKAEEERIAAEAKKAEEERLAAEAKKAEEERLAAEAKKAEEERIAAEAKKAEEERLAAEAKKAEEEQAAPAQTEEEKDPLDSLGFFSASRNKTRQRDVEKEAEEREARERERARAESTSSGELLKPAPENVSDDDDEILRALDKYFVIKHNKDSK